MYLLNPVFLQFTYCYFIFLFLKDSGRSGGQSHGLVIGGACRMTLTLTGVLTGNVHGIR